MVRSEEIVKLTTITSMSDLDITVYRISVESLDELWEKQLKIDFHETPQDEQHGLSKEDERVMESVSHSIKLIDGHYSIRLPLKQRCLKMPNNKTVAEQGAFSLKKGLSKDLSFCSDFLKFMSEMLENTRREFHLSS